MKKRNHFFYFWRAAVKPFFFLFCHPVYKGRENVPEEGAYIIASNHIEASDPILLGIGIKRQIKFMAKAELFENKLVGGFIRRLGSFPVERGSTAAKDSIRHFEQVIQDGDLMGIFIEGTRSKTGEFLRPRNGVSMLVFNTQTPVIPVCITKIGIHRVIHFGKPLSLTDMGFSEGGSREIRNATNVIMDSIKSLREIDLAEAKNNG